MPPPVAFDVFPSIVPPVIFNILFAVLASNVPTLIPPPTSSEVLFWINPPLKLNVPPLYKATPPPAPASFQVLLPFIAWLFIIVPPDIFSLALFLSIIPPPEFAVLFWIVPLVIFMVPPLL